MRGIATVMRKGIGAGKDQIWGVKWGWRTPVRDNRALRWPGALPVCQVDICFLHLIYGYIRAGWRGGEVPKRNRRPFPEGSEVGSEGCCACS